VTAPPRQIVQEFVEAFISAWPQRDAERLAPFFSDDAVWQNGPLPLAHGRQAIVTAIAEAMAIGDSVAVDMIHVLADDNTVLTERVDYVSMSGKTLSMPMIGTFEIRDGAITAWRDYFDLDQFLSQMQEAT
jgi:limonene-1,2-epoxide hydrolase